VCELARHARLRAVALNQLAVLLIGGLRKLKQVRGHTNVLPVELLDAPLEVAREIPAGAVSHLPEALAIEAGSTFLTPW
jgi:hypothetical protein